MLRNIPIARFNLTSSFGVCAKILLRPMFMCQKYPRGNDPLSRI